MPDGSSLRADLHLFLHPEDDARFVMACARARVCGAPEHGMVYVAVHRRHGIWTHVYCVVADRRTDRRMVYLEKAFEGDQVPQAVAWAHSRLIPAAENGAT